MLVPESDVIPSLLCTYPFSPTLFMIIFLPIGHPVGNAIGEEELTDVLVQMYTSSDDNGGLVLWLEEILTDSSFPNCSICCICASENSSEGVEMHLSLSFRPKYSIRLLHYDYTIRSACRCRSEQKNYSGIVLPDINEAFAETSVCIVFVGLNRQFLEPVHPCCRA